MYIATDEMELNLPAIHQETYSTIYEAITTMHLVNIEYIQMQALSIINIMVQEKFSTIETEYELD